MISRDGKYDAIVETFAERLDPLAVVLLVIETDGVHVSGRVLPEVLPELVRSLRRAADDFERDAAAYAAGN